MPEPRQHIETRWRGTAQRTLANESDDRNSESDRRIDCETPRKGDDPVAVCERSEHDKPGDAAECEAGLSEGRRISGVVVRRLGASGPQPGLTLTALPLHRGVEGERRRWHHRRRGTTPVVDPVGRLTVP